MPRVYEVKRARKARPKLGIKKGEPYFWWKTRMKGQRDGVIHRSKLRPRPSQLTSSDYLSKVYAIQEQVEDLDGTASVAEDLEAIAGTLTELASEVREIGDEQREKKDNMPESLREGDVGQLLESRADACESVADKLEAAASELEEFDPDADDSADGEDELDRVGSVLSNALGSLSWDWGG